MNEKDIVEIYKKIKDYHTKYLKLYKVGLPSLYNSKGKLSKDVIVLAKLYEGYPNTKEISKKDLTNFVKQFYPETNDVQQARHLSMQKGWYINSGTRGDIGVSKNSYKLITLEKPYPAYCNSRRAGFDGDFESIKKHYDNRCATCGSKEGKEHFFRKGVIVQLQEGHMDPSKPLKEGNIIPQCQICNRAYRNKWIFDKTGRVIEIANSQDGLRIIQEFLKTANPEYREEILNILNKINKK